MTALPASTSTPPRAVVVGLTAAFVAYCVLLHVLIVERILPEATLLMVVAPWIVASVPALAGLRRSNERGPAIVAGVLVVGSCAAGWWYAARLARQVDRVLLIENLVFLLTLSGLFASTLRSGSVPLIGRLARSVRDRDLTVPERRYTRAVTVAWAAFFAGAALVSIVLFVAAPRVAWSSFVNLALWPLTGAMFALEYAIRLRVLRDTRHVPMMTGVRAFRQRDRVDPRGEAR